MSLRNRNKTYDWARFGGIENEPDMNKITYEIEIRFPIISVSSDKVNNFARVKIDVNDELHIIPPSSVYSIDWGDNSKIMYNFREFTDDWSHTYIREASKNKDPMKYRVTIIGHKLEQLKNIKDLDYIHQVALNVPGSAEDGLIIVRSVD